jgi:glycosyltransferase involved in cell wall biosynthesis
MKTVLLTAYAVNPTKGSEDGMGWNFILQAARFQKVIAITRENNRDAIEARVAQAYKPEYENIQILYFDLPASQRWWKKGGRGSILYFFLWQKNIVRFIQNQKLDYDIVHNLNFHNDWTPSFLWKLGKPFLWGPVGHHSPIPAPFLRCYGLNIKISEIAKALIKKGTRKLPAFKKAAMNADMIFGMNSRVNLGDPDSGKRMILMPSVGTDLKPSTELQKPKGFQVLSAGRFVALKGFDLTIHAFASFVNQLPENERTETTLTLIGAGPEKERLMSLAKSLKMEERVEWVSWVSLSEMDSYYKKSHVFLFPSHEGAGMVVAEAMSHGLPVVCLNNSGPGELVHPHSSLRVEASSYNSTIYDLSEKLLNLRFNSTLYNHESSLALERVIDTLVWDRKGEILRDAYASVSV